MSMVTNRMYSEMMTAVGKFQEGEKKYLAREAQFDAGQAATRQYREKNGRVQKTGSEITKEKNEDFWLSFYASIANWHRSSATMWATVLQAQIAMEKAAES